MKGKQRKDKIEKNNEFDKKMINILNILYDQIFIIVNIILNINIKIITFKILIL